MVNQWLCHAANLATILMIASIFVIVESEIFDALTFYNIIIFLGVNLVSISSLYRRIYANFTMDLFPDVIPFVPVLSKDRKLSNMYGCLVYGPTVVEELGDIILECKLKGNVDLLEEYGDPKEIMKAVLALGTPLSRIDRLRR
jgi:hypothetical protein